MNWTLLVIAFLCAGCFLWLQSFILLYAIQNQHYAYYFGVIGLVGLVSLVSSVRVSRNRPASAHRIRRLFELLLRALTVLALVLGGLVLCCNFVIHQLGD